MRWAGIEMPQLSKLGNFVEQSFVNNV